MATHDLHTTIDIAAPPERVWAVLTDFASYPAWNPFIRQIQGPPTVNTRLDIRIQPVGGRAMAFRPVILEVQPGRSLRWLGRLGFPGLFDGTHGFTLVPLDGGGTRFHQDEHFSGILVGLFRSQLDRQTRPGFELMNQALKTRVEES